MLHTDRFPPAVPEIPVSDINRAAAYYQDHLGFTLDWGGEEGGIAGMSKGACRLFLTNPSFRAPRGNAAPVLVWLNLASNPEVDLLYAAWQQSGARILSPPEDKPWNLREFTVQDLDGNLFRAFHDFSRGSETMPAL